ncbi:hypothetical protein [Cylindrospermum sp. FACHB-282]|uniref:hypothetical protein n=1 Tax=Cylindrospermum sp. FACHB-282 TaxID=2692794 RepID=UPI00168369B5|nr:hypothetical protein [Cylindrospermum sp. FACHB-282]MBD2388641.1 hypothetical protein [Cylindrospermum sp. FACHB-282]
MLADATKMKAEASFVVFGEIEKAIAFGEDGGKSAMVQSARWKPWATPRLHAIAKFDFSTRDIHNWLL